MPGGPFFYVVLCLTWTFLILFVILFFVFEMGLQFDGLTSAALTLAILMALLLWVCKCLSQARGTGERGLMEEDLTDEESS